MQAVAMVLLCGTSARAQKTKISCTPACSAFGGGLAVHGNAPVLSVDIESGAPYRPRSWTAFLMVLLPEPTPLKQWKLTVGGESLSMPWGGAILSGGGIPGYASGNVFKALHLLGKSIDFSEFSSLSKLAGRNVTSYNTFAFSLDPLNTGSTSLGPIRFSNFDGDSGFPIGTVLFAEIDETSSQHRSVLNVSSLLVMTSPPPSALDRLIDFYKRNREESPWLRFVVALASALIAYCLATAVLLLWASRVGSTVFSRTWMLSVASKPLLITPGLTRWVLFLGYGRRLRKAPVVDQASKNYFGLPAVFGDVTLLPDLTGESLNDAIAAVMKTEQVVIISGKGGAGKTTLLARWAYLALRAGLPAQLKSFRPVFVSASYYEGSLLRAIADNLRERQGVAVDPEKMSAQLQSGKFLILFDGVSEIDGDKEKGLKEILRSAQNADYRSCRFLIATRPLEGMPGDLPTFHLQGLSAAAVTKLLPHYGLSREDELQVKRQLQSFGDKTIEPLLLAMALQQAAADPVSSTRAQLYERYFRRLLRAENNQIAWDGWRTALEELANWSLLSSGNRGVGIRHENLMRLIKGTEGKQNQREDLLSRLRDYYHLSFNNGAELVQGLQAAGLVQGGRRWRFSHDTFEEYFAASWLVTYLQEENNFQVAALGGPLVKWVGTPERESEFTTVIDFLTEMADEEVRANVIAANWPELWRQHLASAG